MHRALIPPSVWRRFPNTLLFAQHNENHMSWELLNKNVALIPVNVESIWFCGGDSRRNKLKFTLISNEAWHILYCQKEKSYEHIEWYEVTSHLDLYLDLFGFWKFKQKLEKKWRSQQKSSRPSAWWARRGQSWASPIIVKKDEDKDYKKSYAGRWGRKPIDKH